MTGSPQLEDRDEPFSLKVLGRTLEHLGVQTYKRRDTAIAELVANCWDAGAESVFITVPEKGSYDAATSRITIRDDGCGMTEDEVQDAYLVVGRDRRKGVLPSAAKPRKVMGRKGIGKLAGFGIASRMVILTWKDDTATEFSLNIDDLKKPDNAVEDVAVTARVGTPTEAHGEHGTEIALESLKHVTPLDVDGLRAALARRFSRTTRGEMRIVVNGALLEEPELAITQRFPPDQESCSEEIELLDDSKVEVRYQYAFAETPIASKEMRGFTVYVHGKTAQAPPFFFDVEATATGQLGTKYVTGSIEADFLDDGDEDLISTDRQEIDWEADEVGPLKKWGEELSRRVLREWRDQREKRMEVWVLEEPVIRARIDALDRSSRSQVTKFLRVLGRVEGESEENVRSLADALVQAYEFQHFHDVVHEIEATDDDPEALQALLVHLRDWQVLESRAILEVIRGRLEIVDKFHGMIVNNEPETAPRRGADNVHDLLAGYPWLLNPEWQVLAEERTISRQLREWMCEEIEDEDHRLRYDFMALGDDGRLVVIEIKRSGHPVELQELQRLEEYKERLSKAHERNLSMVMVCGGSFTVSEAHLKTWTDRSDGEILHWNRVFERAKAYYEHYRAILERHIDDPSFTRKAKEVLQTRRVLEGRTAYRGPHVRAQGLGPQDPTPQDDS